VKYSDDELRERGWKRWCRDVSGQWQRNDRAFRAPDAFEEDDCPTFSQWEVEAIEALRDATWNAAIVAAHSAAEDALSVEEALIEIGRLHREAKT
jgi:hypothetical protein